MSYFGAFKDVFPAQWNDQANFILSRNQGIELMCGKFREIKQRCDLHEGQQYNKDTFKNQVKLLVGKTIALKLKNDQKVSIPIDWSAASFGQFSNRQWMAELRKEMANILNA